VLMQHIYDDMDFRSPFFLTFLTNSLLMIYLPLWQVWLLSASCSKLASTTDRSCSAIEMDMSQTAGADNTTINDLHDQAFSDQISTKDQYNPLPSSPSTRIEPINTYINELMPYSHVDVIKVAIIIAPLYVLSNGLYNYSLFMTSVSSSTIISNLSGTFTFAFSWYLGLEVFTYGKVFGILACFLGAVCVGLNDSGETDSSSSGGSGSATGAHNVGGDSVALLGAVFYGLYTTVVQYLIPDDDGISMQLLLGYVGLINVICLSPILLFLYFSGTEHFAHLTWTVLGYMCVSGLFNNVISDYLWARSIVLTSSTVATVGLSIAIPLAMVADFLVHGRAPTGLSSGGAVLVIIGFCLVNISRETESELFRSVFGGAYQRLAVMSLSREGGSLAVPIKQKTSELDMEELCL